MFRTRGLDRGGPGGAMAPTGLLVFGARVRAAEGAEAPLILVPGARKGPGPDSAKSGKSPSAGEKGSKVREAQYDLLHRA